MVRQLQTDAYDGFCAFFSVIHKMSMIVFSVCFFPVLFVFLYIYLDILKISCSHQNQICQVRQAGSRRADQHDHQRDSHDQQRPRGGFLSHVKALRTVAVLVGCFLVLWCPFFVVGIVQLLCKSCQLADVLENYLWLLGLSNSLINPLVYAVWQKEVRLQLAALFSCLTGRLVVTGTPNIARRNVLLNVLTEASVPSRDALNPSLSWPNTDKDKVHTVSLSATVNL